MHLYFVYFHFSHKGDIFWISVLYFLTFYCILEVFVLYCPVFPWNFVLYSCIIKKIAVGGLSLVLQSNFIISSLKLLGNILSYKCNCVFILFTYLYLYMEDYQSVFRVFDDILKIVLNIWYRRWSIRYFKCIIPLIF